MKPKILMKNVKILNSNVAINSTISDNNLLNNSYDNSDTLKKILLEIIGLKNDFEQLKILFLDKTKCLDKSQSKKLISDIERNN